jgi:hypothetical protein
LFDNLVIKGFQGLLIDAFDQILAYNDISLNLYFKTLQPLEFTDLENVEDEETKEEETGVKLSAESNKELDKFIELGQKEEDLLEEFDLIDEMSVDYELEDELDQKIDELNNEIKLAQVGKAKPYKESEQDGKSKKEGKEDITYLVRYMYTESAQGANPLKTNLSREFCVKMMRANKVYRKEDIIAMENVAVNPDFAGKNKTTYSIWLYKGGARCKHYWTRKIYARKDGEKSLGNTISTTKARAEGFRPQANPNKVSIAPRNMQYKGYTAAYWNKMGFKN